MLAASIFLSRSRTHLYLHSFPTRRSSDLDLVVQREGAWLVVDGAACVTNIHGEAHAAQQCRGHRAHRPVDRKSTRLNSSHSQISYAVFCLKKKRTRPARSASLTPRPWELS